MRILAGRSVWCLCVACATVITCAQTAAETSLDGKWSGSLTCPGGDIWFGFEFSGGQGVILNGPERIEIASLRQAADQLTIEFPHYDSVIDAQLQGGEYIGSWKKTRGEGRRPELPFRMSRGTPNKSSAGFEKYQGRWKVQFSSSDDPAIGLFQTTKGVNWGTFLTSTGDYRFLSARVLDEELRLSVFDGAHAFLFRATARGDQLQGDFWSGDHWHETWVADRDDSVRLDSGFAGPEGVAVADFDQLRFRNLQGELTAVAAEARRGKAVILELFGSWCPNCHDAADWLGQLDQEYTDDQLSIIGLAFELTGDVQRDTAQVRRYVERFHIRYPVYIAGLADKQVASQQFALLDRVRAYPTTIFMNNRGNIVAVYHGFSGPATGEEYIKLQAEFRRVIDEIIEASS